MRFEVAAGFWVAAAAATAAAAAAAGGGRMHWPLCWAVCQWYMSRLVSHSRRVPLPRSAAAGAAAAAAGVGAGPGMAVGAGVGAGAGAGVARGVPPLHKTLVNLSWLGLTLTA